MRVDSVALSTVADGKQVAAALRICDEGDLDGMEAQWAAHPPALWVALAATADSDDSEVGGRR